jgi:hypothetical protein
MADNILNNVRIAHKNDTKSNWATKNPVLLKGEIGIEFDPSVTDNSYVVKFKIGDGTSNWADLDYFGGEVTLPAPDGTSIVADGNTWSIAGFGAATANKFPVKRITGSTASIEWVALPSHIANLDTMYSKLSGIEAGAQVNTVDSVNGKTGEVTLSASDVGAEPAFTKNTAFNKNFETNAANIKVNGTAAVGTSSNVARADHVHPTDTTRAAAADLTAHTGNTSNPHNVTAEQIEAVSYGDAQTLTTDQKTQALTNIGAEPAFTKNTAFNKNFETTAANIKANGTASAGSSSKVAKADHVHPTDTTRAAAADLTAHTGNTSNPHNVTKAQVGLSNVGNFKAVSTVANQGLTDTEKSAARANIGAGTSSFSGSYNDLTDKPTLRTAAAKDVAASGNAAATEVVMGNDTRLTDARKASDVSAWAKASTKPTYTASEVGAIPTTQKGAASGVATLDANGHVPTSQLPSFVDDVLEGSAQSVTQSAAGTYTATGFILKGETKACTPEDGKIYIDSVGDSATNIEFRWTGTQFASIGTNLVLGETSNTAYRGDRGKTAYDHSQSAHAPANAEANVINAITVGGTAATITNKSAAIPIATSSKAGVVKSSSSNNTVAVNSSSGVMTVNKITTDKLAAGTNTLILDCGNATI